MYCIVHMYPAEIETLRADAVAKFPSSSSEAIPKPNLQRKLHIDVFLAGKQVIVATLIEKKAMLGTLLAAILIQVRRSDDYTYVFFFFMATARYKCYCIVQGYGMLEVWASEKFLAPLLALITNFRTSKGGKKEESSKLVVSVKR